MLEIGCAVIFFLSSHFFLFIDDLATSNRHVTSACLNVYTKSGFVDVGGGKTVHVGTQQDMFAQVKYTDIEKST